MSPMTTFLRFEFFNRSTLSRSRPYTCIRRTQSSDDRIEPGKDKEDPLRFFVRLTCFAQLPTLTLPHSSHLNRAEEGLHQQCICAECIKCTRISANAPDAGRSRGELLVKPDDPPRPALAAEYVQRPSTTAPHVANGTRVANRRRASPVSMPEFGRLGGHSPTTAACV
jgi:hypothetical protein